MVVTLALLGHQTSHSQNKFFFSLVAQCTNILCLDFYYKNFRLEKTFSHFPQILAFLNVYIINTFLFPIKLYIKIKKKIKDTLLTFKSAKNRIENNKIEFLDHLIKKIILVSHKFIYNV